MSDFEKIVSNLRDNENSPYQEGTHFDVYEWENEKEIDLRPTRFSEEWVYFYFDKDGNLLSITLKKEVI